MDMYDLSSIADYLHMLRDVHGLSISLHPDPTRESLLSTSELMSFNIHRNPYCAFIKSNRAAGQHCVACQKKVTARCAQGACEGVCYAGVREWVYPITDGESCVGFISVSGYRVADYAPYRQRLQDAYGFDRAALTDAYGHLNGAFPDRWETNTLLTPLCQMLELAYRKADSPTAPVSFSDKVIRYIKQNRHRDISSRDICRELYCSRSHMSTVFNEATGTTIPAYITALRLEDAKALLEQTALNVTEIAYSVGFGNSNYFSQKFKQHTGMTPLEYRKAVRG